MIGFPSVVGAVGIESPWSARTSGEDVLITHRVEVPPGLAIGYPDRIRLELGFSSLEMPEAGRLFDSFTVSLEALGGSGAVALLTLDAFGLERAPEMDGGPDFAPDAVRVVAADPLVDPVPGHAVSFAYQLEARVPEAWRGEDWVIRFDLFDNGDGRMSQAYGQVEVVPEPSSLALLLLSAGWAWGWRYRPWKA